MDPSRPCDVCRGTRASLRAHPLMRLAAARTARIDRSASGCSPKESPVLPSFSPALLALADGTVFRGYSIGAPGHTIGEVVFNTAITGYQEILTDPSYARQIVTLTYPHIGNTGTNDVDVEADRVHAAGLIVRDVPRLASNWRSTEPLPHYLERHNVVAIAGIDTPRLT